MSRQLSDLTPHQPFSREAGRPLRPTPSGVRTSHPRVDRNHFQAPKKILDPATPATGTDRVRLDFETKPQFAERDDADRYRFRRSRMKPGRQVKTFTSSAISNELSRISPTDW